MNKVIYCETCVLCFRVVAIEDGVIDITDTITSEYDITSCDHDKNGYCGFFIAQAILDKIEFNMHDKTPSKNNSK